MARALAFAYATVELHSRQIAAGSSLSERERAQATARLRQSRSQVAEISAITPTNASRRALADQMIANWSPDVVSPQPKATRETPGKSGLTTSTRFAVIE